MLLYDLSLLVVPQGGGRVFEVVLLVLRPLQVVVVVTEDQHGAGRPTV
jgi:hypothetical protein